MAQTYLTTYLLTSGLNLSESRYCKELVSVFHLERRMPLSDQVVLAKAQ